LTNVLEHVPYPAKVLDGILDVVVAESIVYIEVPLDAIMSLDGATALAAKRHWHEHINCFSKQALATLLAETGFFVESIVQTEVFAFGSHGSILQAVARRAE
jgi:hypothetical protein